MSGDMLIIPPDADRELPSENTLVGKAARFVLNRFPIWPFVKLMTKKDVPSHRSSFWYVLGGIALLFLVVQVVTGILLMVYYRPGQPWESVLRIVEEVPYGDVLRTVHHYGANIMLGVLILHMFSTMLMKAYRPPREFTWLTGLGLIAITLGFGFTGYLLPWDELSFFATKVGLSETEKMPILGPWLADLLRGGSDVTVDTIGRFYLIHVVLLPLSVIGLVSLHMLFIQLQGISEPDRFRALPTEKKRYKKFFTQYLPKEALIWLVLLIIVIVVALHFPRELEPVADRFAPAPEGIKPEWYFLANYQLLKLFPGRLELLGVALMSSVPLLLAALPFIDRSTPTDKRGKLVTVGALLGIAAFAGLTVWGYLS